MVLPSRIACYLHASILVRQPDAALAGQCPKGT